MIAVELVIVLLAIFLESVHNSVSRLKYHYNVITLSRRPSK